MGKIEVFKFDRTGVVGVRNFNFIFIFLPNEPAVLIVEIFTGIRVRSGAFANFRFCSVSGFRLNGFCQDILLFKQHLDCISNLVDGPFAALQSGYHGDQHVGVMLDFVKFKVILVIIVRVLIGVEVLLQLCLQSAVLCFGSSHIAIFHGVSGRTKCRNCTLRDDGAGRHDIEQKSKHYGQTANEQKGLLVLCKELGDLLCSFSTLLGSLCSNLGSFCSTACRRTGFGSHIFLLDGSFLLPSGIRVT